MVIDRRIKIVPDKDFFNEIGSSPNSEFVNILKIRGVGHILAISSYTREEISENFYRDIRTLAISKSDAEIIINYVLSDGDTENSLKINVPE